MDKISVRQEKRLCHTVYRAVHGQAPPYISDLFTIKEHVREMKGRNRLDLPRVASTTYGLRSLSYRGARMWNALDDDAKSKDFKDSLKSDFFEDFDENIKF